MQTTNKLTFPKILLIAEFQPKPFSAPAFWYAEVVRTTAQTTIYSIGTEQKRILKRLVIAITSNEQQNDWEHMYQKYQQLMKKYAQAIMSLKRYDLALEKRQGCPSRQIPNPLSEYILECQSQTDCAVFAWEIPGARLLKAEKHTPIMVRTLTEEGLIWGLVRQTRVFLIERERWNAIESARNAVQTQNSKIQSWLKKQAWSDQAEPSLPLPLFAGAETFKK